MRTEGPHAKHDKEEKNGLDLLSSFIDTNIASNFLPTSGFLVMCRKDIFCTDYLISQSWVIYIIIYKYTCPILFFIHSSIAGTYVASIS